jgi:bifunctional non-homologous end joining protein LigD
VECGAALRKRTKQFGIDGEAVVLGVDGISDFNALHSRKHDDEVQFYVFDMLVSGGDDIRELPLHVRKTTSPACSHATSTAFSRQISSRAKSAQTSSATPASWGWRNWYQKHKDRPYRAGHSPYWIKVKDAASDESRTMTGSPAQ